MSQEAESASQKGQPLPTPAQSGVIFALSLSDGATMGELAQTLDLAPSAVSGLIQRMEAIDWVARHPCPDDGRTQRVWLRPSGQNLLPVLKQTTKRINDRLAEGFSESELQVVSRWLKHVQQIDRPAPPTP